ncbi:MAG: oxidoreductase [Bacteroidetes bacterium MED-G17]|jgi:NAD(P)-dependent dehydrogenase (short-subunit alcohol dehydrogenase family)|nr:MAG: oxidoreductase [Bacteroidetes bacterium MED-G17]CAI8318556.1 MAG: putative 2,4-dienoyl-CoA reductase [Bacteroidetes bacterium MED-G17]|tara:strand:- start:12272 stop:12952 length:681 start_codon:yes stop_codon:yes gene_type:complete
MKKAILIGGTSGIGNSLLKILQENEWEVHVISRNAGEHVSSSNTYFYSADVTKEDPSFPAIEGIDGFVYLPGSINLKPFRALKPDFFMADFQINLLGAVKALQHFSPNFNPEASSVLYSTVAVQKGMSFHSSVASAKGAVEGLVRSLAAEWAPKYRVNCIAPSLTDTPLAERLLRNDKMREAAKDRHPLKRIGSAEDIASATHFLLSNKSKFITGQIIGIDGGLSG